MTHLRRAVNVVVLCAVLVVSMSAVAPGIAGSAASSPHEEESWPAMDGKPFQNFTMYLYGDSSHAPGESDVSIWTETIVHSLPEDGRRAWLNQSVTATPWVSACELQNLNHFGIDRKPPDNGTGGGTTTYYQSQTEGQVTSVDTEGGATWRAKGGVEKYEEYLGRDTTGMDAKHSEFPLSTNGWDAEFIQTERVKFWNRKQAKSDDGDRKSGQKTTFEYENMDRVIVDYSNCYTNPDKPGWYRQTSLSESYWVDATGTPSDDKSTWPGGVQYAPVTYSHWVYICKCQSYDEAVNKIGKPPEMNGTKVKKSEEYAQYYGDQGGSTPTSTPGRATATSTAGGTATATPDSGNTTATPSATTTSPGGGGTTATSPGGTTATSPDKSTQTQDGTDTVPGPNNDGGGTQGGAVETNTTQTGQPGFGVLAALLAVFAATLLLRRR